MRIAVDVDEVLTPFLASFILKYNEWHGTTFSVDQVNTYRIHDIFGKEREFVVGQVRRYYREHLHQLEPNPEAISSLQRLKKAGHDLIIVTGRHNEAVEVTRKWIKDHFGTLFSSVNFASHRGLNGHLEDKAGVCKRLGANVLIDDDPHYVEQCKQRGIKLILLEQPWNRDAIGLKVKNWKEIEKSIQKMLTP